MVKIVTQAGLEFEGYDMGELADPQNGESVSSVGLLNSIKQAYFRIGIHTAPPGTWVATVAPGTFCRTFPAAVAGIENGDERLL